MNDIVVAPEPTAPKQALSICVCKNGQVILRQGTPDPAKEIRLPMNVSGYLRLFVKNGELVSPFVVFHFHHRKTLDVSGIEISLYHEKGMDPFDPTDLVPVPVRSLEQDFNELNG